jgi:hypothetical protein
LAFSTARRWQRFQWSASPRSTRVSPKAVENAVFIRDRLRTVLPRLHTRLKQIEAAEYLARWEPEYKRVIAQRDALAAEMREVYPAAVAQLADLFQRATQCDREISQLNQSAPSGDRRGIHGVELTARGVEALLQPDVRIAETLRLPFFQRDRGPIFVWPPATPPAAYTFPVPSGPGPDWHKEIEARNAARAEESRRVAALHEDRHLASLV